MGKKKGNFDIIELSASGAVKILLWGFPSTFTARNPISSNS